MKRALTLFFYSPKAILMFLLDALLYVPEKFSKKIEKNLKYFEENRNRESNNRCKRKKIRRIIHAI